MTDKYHGDIVAGATDVTIPVILRATVDNTGLTGASAGNVTASFWRQGASNVTFPVSNAASLLAAHNDGDWFEADSANAGGLYRLDLPDSAVAAGVDFVAIAVKATAAYVFFERFALASAVATQAGNGASIASVSAVVGNNIVNYHLDHLIHTSAPAGLPVSNTLMNKVMVDALGATFSQASHSLRAIRAKIDTLNDTTIASVSAAVQNNVVNYHLDHLLHTSAPAGVPASNTVVHTIQTSGAAGSFDRATHSLRAIRERGDASWGTATGFATQSHVASNAGLIAGKPTIASVSAAVANNITNYNLDHLLHTSAPAGVPVSNTVLEKIMVSAAGGVFSQATDSLRAIRDKADGITAGGGVSAGSVATIAASNAALIVGKPTIASVSAAVANNITNYHLDHLLHTSAPAGVPASNTVVEKLMVSSAGGVFSQATDSLRAIADRAGTGGAGGGVTAASVGHAVFHYSLSAGMVSGQAGYILRSAAANAGATVSGAVSSADISSFWNRPRGSNNASGSFGEAINLLYGSGNVPVNHNTGGSNNLRIQQSGSGVDEVQIRIYKKSDFDSGLVTVPYIQGQSISDTNGDWKTPVYLDSGTTYTVVFTKPGSIEETTKEFSL